jgi:hypothetical protein
MFTGDFSSEWIYWLGWAGVVCVFIAMIALAWWSLFGDRPSDRRRCPKCWYDMRYSPGMSCSECGFTARDERQLKRVKRRYGLAALAMLTCVVMAINIQYQADENGYASLMPTRMLVMSLALTDNPRGAAFQEVMRRFEEGLLTTKQVHLAVDRCVRGDWAARPGSDAWARTYGMVLLRWRGEIRRMAATERDPEIAAAWREIERRMLDAPVLADLVVREAWPADVRVVALLAIDEWWPLDTQMRITVTPREESAPPRVFYRVNGRASVSGISVALPVTGNGLSMVEADVSIERRTEENAEWTSHWSGSVSAPVRIAGSIEDLIAGVSTSEQAETMQRVFTGRVQRWASGRSPLRFFYDPWRTSFSAFDDVAIGVEMVLTHNDRVVRELHIWWMGGFNTADERHRGLGFEIVHEDIEAIHSISPDSPGWLMTITGRPEIALRAGDAKYFWNGTFTTPGRFRNSNAPAPPPDYWTDSNEDHDQDIAH